MAHYKASVNTRRPPDEMFAYLSDFSTTQEWERISLRWILPDNQRQVR